MPLTLRIYGEELSLCRLALDAQAPADILKNPFTYFFRTRDEATLICPTALAPKNVKTEGGFIAIEFVGPFEFALTGILTQVANPLAAAGVSIVALSTSTRTTFSSKPINARQPLPLSRKPGTT